MEFEPIWPPRSLRHSNSELDNSSLGRAFNLRKTHCNPQMPGGNRGGVAVQYEQQVCKENCEHTFVTVEYAWFNERGETCEETQRTMTV